jgi:hypothetical protein
MEVRKSHKCTSTASRRQWNRSRDRGGTDRIAQNNNCPNYF